MPAWFLDTDYNGLCFHVSPGVLPAHERLGQPQEGAQGRLRGTVWDHLPARRARRSSAGEHGEIAVKVIDDRGNELLVVKSSGRGASDERTYEVAEPILNSPFEEPARALAHRGGRDAGAAAGPAAGRVLLPRPEGAAAPRSDAAAQAVPVELELVNLIRERRRGSGASAGYPGVTPHDAGTAAILAARRAAAAAVLRPARGGRDDHLPDEARADFRQGIDVPRDEPSDDEKAEGYTGFRRYACKMATGSGKTTVMGMLAAWSILNKVNDRGDARSPTWCWSSARTSPSATGCGELDPERARRASTGRATWCRRT